MNLSVYTIVDGLWQDVLFTGDAQSCVDFAAAYSSSHNVELIIC